MHKLLERQLKKWYPGYPDISPEMESLIQAINESYFHFDNDRLLMENAMKASSMELSQKRQQIKCLFDEQTAAVDSLRSAVSKLLPNQDLDHGNNLLRIADALKEIILEKSKAQQLQEQSEQRLLSVIDNLELGMIEYDLEGRLTSVQSKFSAMFGYQSHELVGKKSDFFRSSDSPTSNQFAFLLHNAVFESGMIKRHGELFWLLCTTYPLFDALGCQNGGVMIVFDISKQKQLECELRNSRKAAEAGLEARKSILSNVSHELRTPVNAIVGLSSLLANTELDNLQKDYINTLKFSAEGLLVLIDDLLDVSRIESGKVEIEKIPFSFLEILTLMSKSLGLKAAEKGLEFCVELDEDLHEYFMGDPHRINQVATNLIGNAIKFTNDGKITIQISLLNDHENSQTIRVSVSDTGIGIAPERMDAIFEDFTQEDAGTSRRFGGTGLGLSISSRIVELMGSKLLVSSEKGKGSEFYFTITLEKALSKDQRELEFLPDLSNVHVLLVEDNPVNQYLASALLENWNARVQICNNGVEALDLVDKGNFDIILMDLQMPVKDGFETTMIIRNEKKIEVPIIALTANAMSGEKEACMKAGMDDYVTKPFQPQKLYFVIKGLLDEQQKRLSA